MDPYLQSVKLTRSVWYKFEAPFATTTNRVILADRSGLRVGIFKLLDPDGNAGTLELVTENANTTVNDTETLTFETTVGQTYYVCVEANGAFDITLQLAGQENDAYADAMTVTGNEGDLSGSTTGASDDGDVPSVLPTTVPSHGVWYKWTAPSSGTIVFDTSFSQIAPDVEHDTAIAVFIGSSLSGLVEVASDDDSGKGSNARVSFNAVSATTYTIWVGDGVNSTAGGDFVLSYFPATSAGVFYIDGGGYVAETQGTVQARVQRRHAGNVAVAVTAVTLNGSAQGGSTDYVSFSNTLNFPAVGSMGDDCWEISFDVTIVADIAPESDEDFSVVLNNPTNGATFGMGSSIGYIIRDHQDTTAPGFPFTTVRAKEGTDNYYYILMTREHSEGYSTVKCYLSQPRTDTATLGRDFSFPNGTSVTMIPGQTSAYLVVGIYNDGLREGPEKFTITAKTPSNQTVDNSYTTTVTIDDDDGTPTIPGRLSCYVDLGGIAGYVDATIATTGVVTGKVYLASGTYSFTGPFDNTGRFITSVGPTGLKRTLTIDLLSAATKSFNVQLADNELGNYASVEARMLTYSTLNPSPFAATYTATDTFHLFASLKVDGLGSVTASGKLFDGTAFTASGALTTTGSGIVNIGNTLYSNKGRSVILTSLPPSINSTATGQFGFVRPGRANQIVELAPIRGYFSMATARYVVPSTGQRALSVWSGGTGQCYLSGGGFNPMASVPKALAISTANRITVTSTPTDGLSLTLAPATGLFIGSVIPPGGTAKNINGVLIQGGVMNVVGVGAFVNGSLIGVAQLTGP